MTTNFSQKSDRQKLRQFNKFLDTFMSCNEVKEATENGILSTDKKFTKKILKQISDEEQKMKLKEEKEEEKKFLETCKLAGIDPPPLAFKQSIKQNSSPVKSPSKSKRKQEKNNVDSLTNLLKKKEATLPWPFDDLLLLQNYDGRWLDVEQMYDCLGLPYAKYFTQGELSGPAPSSWEQATALAIAKIRNRYDLFASLGDAHDRALAWIKDQNILRLASDVIYFCEKKGFGKERRRRDELGDSRSLQPPVDEYMEVMKASAVTNYARVQYQARLKTEKLAAKEGVAEKQIADERRMIAEACLIKEVNFSKMISQVEQLQRDVEMFEYKCIEQMTFVDKLRKELKKCLDRCVDNYKNCKLHYERNSSFLELQASLAEDVPARVGFTGWQAVGKKGYRTAVLALLVTLFDLGNARIVLREVCLTGIHMDKRIVANNFEANEFYLLIKKLHDNLSPTSEAADMFYMSWNGQDMMKYIYTSLDFLYQCPLLVKWFGNGYPWFGNPIAFCVPFEKMCHDFITESKVQAFIERLDRNAKQSCRYLMSSQANITKSRPVIDMKKDAEIARKDDRTLRDDVLKCQEYLESCMEKLPSWWPKGVEVSDLNRVNVVNRALLTLRVTTREYAKTNRHTLRLCGIEYNDALVNSSLPSALDSSQGGDFGPEDQGRELLKSETAPGRLIKTSTSDHESSGVRGQALLSGGAGGGNDKLRSNKTCPEDFKTWLFYDDWYDDYHSQPAVIAEKKAKKKESERQKTRSYFVRSRPGSESGQRPSSSHGELKRLPSAQRVLSPKQMNDEVTSPENNLDKSVDLLDENVLQNHSRQNKDINTARGTSTSTAAVMSRRHDNVVGSDIGGDIFSALDSPTKNKNSGDDNKNNPNEMKDNDSPTERVFESKVTFGEDDVIKLFQEEDGGESQEESHLEGGGSFYEDDSGGEENNSVGSVESILELNKLSIIKEQGVDNSSPRQDEDNGEGDEDDNNDIDINDPTQVRVSSQDDESIASLSLTVKRQNLMHTDQVAISDNNGTSSSSILVTELGRNIVTNNKNIESNNNAKGGGSKDDATNKNTKQDVDGTTKQLLNKAAVDKKNNKEKQKQDNKEKQIHDLTEKEKDQREKDIAQKEKDIKKKRKATVNDRIQAARKGRGAVLGGESDENEDPDNLPVIVKKRTVSRVASSKNGSGQPMTRRAKGNALVMPPLPQSTEKVITRRTNM